jgi:hypothetical protein
LLASTKSAFLHLATHKDHGSGDEAMNYGTALTYNASYYQSFICSSKERTSKCFQTFPPY